MPSHSIKLSDVVAVRARFGRSVNLERDFYERVPLDGYILTPTARAALHRLGHALVDPAAARAYTVTGPYGSGKSALALFAAKAFSTDADGDTNSAGRLIKEQDRELWNNLFDRRRKTALQGRGLCPVLVSGSREPLAVALLRGLARSMENFWTKKPPQLLGEVRSLLAASEAGNAPSGREVAEIFERAAQKVCSSSNPGDGLLVVVDELGKLLEYAAAHPEESDVFVLQELAEAAKRSMNCPILLVTILHQTFDRYVERLDRAQKEEWMKVQGRFEDIAFQEPVEQILRILTHAIRRDGPREAVQALERHGQQLARRAGELDLTLDAVKKSVFLELLAGCVPLHPTVAIAAGYLFRKLGQNERSLFAFLNSLEPHGFQEFLVATSWDESQRRTFRLDNLYDYVTNALGSGLYAHGNGKRWAEVEASLNRLVDPTEIEVRLIKTVGLLRVIGDVGNLKPSKDLLRFALEDGKTSAKEIDRALDQLQKKSIIIYRKHSKAYSLWEGSDIDIEERLAEARGQIDPNEPLTHSLTKYFKPKPIVARRHSFQTGTLRFFDARYVSLGDLGAALNEPIGDADGLILYAIALNAAELKAFTEKARDQGMDDLPQVLIAVPQETAKLREAVLEVACLSWVKDNTPELAGDRVARNELQSRLTEAEKAVTQLLQSFFDSDADGTSAHAGRGCMWYHKGERVEVSSQRALQEYLSEVCRDVFHMAPVLHNEMINRRQISTTAASARRELIEAMLARGDEKALGIEGYPPQKSMYFSLLEKTGIHREQDGRWGFYSPTLENGTRMEGVWNAIDQFFAETEIRRRSIAELFDMLGRAPYGMKLGPLPVLLCAALLHYDTEMALYEQGSFVPALSAAVFERLVKAPDRFHIQRCRVAGVRAVIFEEYAKTLTQRPERILVGKPNLVVVVRRLYKFFASLPEYTKNTQRLSETAQRVRSAIFEAREPDRLLFVKLPEACGLKPFASEEARDRTEVERFFKSLRAALAELQRAYDDLLSDLESRLVAAFSLKGRGGEARAELALRARPLFDLTVEPRLKSLILRATDEGLDLIGWIESIATLLADRPPATWNDTDLALFEVNLAEVSRVFTHVELLSFEIRRLGREALPSGFEVLRLGVTAPNEPELQRVITVGPLERSLVATAEISVEDALEKAGLNGNLELRLAVLAKLSKKFIGRLEDGAPVAHTKGKRGRKRKGSNDSRDQRKRKD